jgi:hypothetical protein
MGKLSDDIVSYRFGTGLRSEGFPLFNEREKKRFKSTAAGIPEELSAIRLFLGSTGITRSW